VSTSNLQNKVPAIASAVAAGGSTDQLGDLVRFANLATRVVQQGNLPDVGPFLRKIFPPRLANYIDRMGWYLFAQDVVGQFMPRVANQLDIVAGARPQSRSILGRSGKQVRVLQVAAQKDFQRHKESIPPEDISELLFNYMKLHAAHQSACGAERWLAKGKGPEAREATSRRLGFEQDLDALLDQLNTASNNLSGIKQLQARLDQTQATLSAALQAGQIAPDVTCVAAQLDAAMRAVKTLSDNLQRLTSASKSSAQVSASASNPGAQNPPSKPKSKAKKAGSKPESKANKSSSTPKSKAKGGKLL
jgi:uncharacterized protein YoxC